MATANGSNECSSSNGSVGSSNSNAAIPQWKRDLILRRRQQNKVLTSNGASVKLCTAVTSTLASNNGGTVDSTTESPEPVERQEQYQESAASRTRTPDSIGSCSEYSSGSCQQQFNSLRITTSCGATVSRENLDGGDDRAGNIAVSSVSCNMRLEADASSLCPSTEDARNNQHVVSAMERGNLNFENYDNEDAMRNYANSGGGVNNKRSSNQEVEQEGRGSRASRIIRRIDMEITAGVCLFPADQTGKSRIDKNFDTKTQPGNGKKSSLGDECESDSSEELQYGPGIVNRLKSKYLNLTLREMNKSRGSVQRFRRAASLEDLLDCDDEPGEKSARKYAKRNSPGVVPKADRFRNAARGNESMKRARSVETLMRYNAPLVTPEETIQSNRLIGIRQEPVNDHIVLIDRTSVKIESRLGDPDRPKAVNKPKRIKPLLAETERPPPDLVKTTMRIFEGSVKKFKPKGEVAVKVATFKTINDTYKAQALKKVVPKPPIQPKPFVNGNAKAPPSSPKKILVPQKPTAELIEKSEGSEEYRNDGVVTEPIVQSVSSVVSKFQQIEKSHSPSPSPEPYKLKFSPTASPEPPKIKGTNESIVKSPPATPVPSPRISSPALIRQNSSPVHQTSSSPTRELYRQASAPEIPKNGLRNEDKELVKPIVDDSRQENEESMENVEIVKEESKSLIEDESLPGEASGECETVDGGHRTISKLALDNISKAGNTVQFNFGDKPSIGKSYLPGSTPNVQKSSTTNGLTESKTSLSSSEPKMVETCSSPVTSMEASNNDQAFRLQERLEPEKIPEIKLAPRAPSPSANLPEYNKPIGAISALGMIKSTSTSPASYPSSNDGKTIRSQKSDISPPQKQIGIIRPLVSTKTPIAQQNLSNRELEKNLINRVKSIEQPTKVVVSLKSSDEIQPMKKTADSPGSGGGLWDTKPWNQANNTMVFNFSNRKDVPDYIENDGLIIRRKREKPKVR